MDDLFKRLEGGSRRTTNTASAAGSPSTANPAPTAPTATTGMTMAHVLSLPDEQRTLMTWLMRRGSTPLAEIASHLGQPEASARLLIEGLVAQGYAAEEEEDGQPCYRSNVAASAPRRSRVPTDIWAALDGGPAPRERRT